MDRLSCGCFIGKIDITRTGIDAKKLRGECCICIFVLAAIFSGILSWTDNGRFCEFYISGFGYS